MELLLAKMAIKPTLKKKEDVVVKIAQPTAIIIDKQAEYKNFNINAVKQKLRDVLEIVPQQPTEQPKVIPVKPKPIKKKLLIVQPEEEEAEVERMERVEKEKEKPIPKKAEKVKKGRIEKVKRGVITIDPEDWVDVSKDGLPPAKPTYKIKVDSYFMNNRAKFVNFINTIFHPYREEFLSEMKNSTITCDTIGSSSGNFELLTHQKLVRDYMNLYTPYRGLLLYFSLGSGKCHSLDTPILMADGTIKMVQDIQVGDQLMGDNSTPRNVLSLARGRDIRLMKNISCV